MLDPEPPVDDAPLPNSAQSEPLPSVSESRPEVLAVPVANTEAWSMLAMELSPEIGAIHDQVIRSVPIHGFFT